MKKPILLLLPFVLALTTASTQEVDSIFINLYYDSIKLNVHNYINVDAKLSNGRYIPLSAKEVAFSSDYGKWEGNSLIIDSGCRKNFITITASLKSNPRLKKTTIIYIKKQNEVPVLPTTEELLERWKKEAKDRKKNKGR